MASWQRRASFAIGETMTHMGRVAGLLLVVLAVALAACGDSDSTESSGTTAAAPSTETATCPKGTVAADDVVGLTVDQAKAVALEQGCEEIRVIERDGKHLPTTMDFRVDRLNVAVTDGKVTSIDGVY